MSVEGTVKLLWDCSNALSAETHTNKLLKSYYINTCRKIARHNLQIPKEKFAVSQMCPRCSVFWGESEFKLRVKPQHVAANGKAKKLIAKLEEAQSTSKSGLLTKKQRRRAKWLKKRVSSSIEIACEMCKKKSLIPLQKPKERRKTQDETAAVEEAKVAATKPKAKKKKNKNKTAGLKIEHIIKKEKVVKGSSDSTKTLIPPTENKVESKTMKSNKEAAPSPSAKVKAAATSSNSSSPKVPASSPKGSASSPKGSAPSPKVTAKNPKAAVPAKSQKVASTKPAPNLSQPLKSKKKKKYKSAQTPVAPTVKSQTQQKNSLLQLAALLKTQSKKTNTPQNRLQSLLK